MNIIVKLKNYLIQTESKITVKPMELCDSYVNVNLHNMLRLQ